MKREAYEHNQRERVLISKTMSTSEFRSFPSECCFFFLLSFSLDVSSSFEDYEELSDGSVFVVDLLASIESDGTLSVQIAADRVS